jgi:hypothetical protein
LCWPLLNIFIFSSAAGLFSICFFSSAGTCGFSASAAVFVLFVVSFGAAFVFSVVSFGAAFGFFGRRIKTTLLSSRMGGAQRGAA